MMFHRRPWLLIIRVTPAARGATQSFSAAELPLTECLKDTVARFLPYWHQTIVPDLKNGQRVFIAATATACGRWSSILTTSLIKRSWT